MWISLAHPAAPWLVDSLAHCWWIARLRNDRQVRQLELGAAPALPGRHRGQEGEIDACTDADLAVTEAKPDRGACRGAIIFERELQVGAAAAPARGGDPDVARAEPGRRILLTERPQAGELLREPLVDLGEPHLGVVIAPACDRPGTSGELRAGP